MEHISLYRKWRPQTFADVIGQRHVTNTLANALSSGRLVHAYLFCGPRGTGKTSTARILAKAINCVEGPTATPCNVCEACTSISAGTALDVIEIDAASNRKIDEIRELLDKIPYMPTSLRSKVYIIDEVHQLTEFAASALLKTLEEPPAHVVFVLATTEPQDLLPTIVSRCQRYDFSLVQAQEISSLLEKIASSEGIIIDNEAIEMIAEHAHGSIRDAIGVIDQISNLSTEQITRAQLAELLGVVETELVFKMVDLLAERDTPGALALVGDMVDSGKDPRSFTESLITHLRNMFLIQNASNPAEIVEATADHFQRLTEQSESLSRHEVIKLMERMGEACREMRSSDNPRLVLECAVVKNTSLDADVSLEGLSFRIEQLERKIDALGAAGAGVLQGEKTTPKSGPTVSPPARPATAEVADRRSRGAKQAVREKAEGSAASQKGRRRRPAEAAEGAGGEEGGAPYLDDSRQPSEPREGVEWTGASGSDREKVRRAWMAVLGELKKMGLMKLYALLTKARVRGVEGGALVLGFPEDALFQMRILAESPEDIAAIEGTWERFVGKPIKVKLVSLGEAPERQADAATLSRPPARAGDSAEPVDAGEKGTAAKEAESGGPKPSPGRPKKADSNEITKLLKERFDGEIIEKEKEGKE